MMDWQAFLAPIGLSVRISIAASVLVIVLGVLTAYWMVEHRVIGKTWLETLFMLPLVLPPTVVGFLLLLALGRQSWIGWAAERVLGGPVIFTWQAGVIAAVAVSFPLVYQTLKAGFASVPVQYKDAARLDGASNWQVLRTITMPLAARSLLTAWILGFARALGEFGATLMIAGNIPGRTQTVSTAIYTAVETNQMAMAWGWTVVVLMISFVLLYITRARRFEAADG